MIRIAVIDDNVIAMEELAGKIEKIIKLVVDDFYIHSYVSGAEMIKMGKEYDIVFLDMEMPDLDGIAVGEELRKKQPACKIIMETGNTIRFKEAFRINVFRYLTKPYDDEEIEESIQSCLKEMIGIRRIEVYSHRILYKIEEKEICYIQAYNGYVNVYTEDEIYRRDISLEAFAELVDVRMFYRINRQYIVNLWNIQDYMQGNVTINGTVIKIPSLKKKKFEEKYHEFLKKYKGE